MKKKDVQVTESESVSEVTFLTIFLRGPGLRRKERVEKKCRFLFSLIPKLCFSRLKDPIQFPAECTFRASHGSALPQPGIQHSGPSREPAEGPHAFAGAGSLLECLSSLLECSCGPNRSHVPSSEAFVPSQGQNSVLGSASVASAALCCYHSSHTEF